MNWKDILYDPGSTTKAFKFLTSDYKLEVLFSDYVQDLFKRIIIIKLDDIPVMLAISETDTTNDIFLDILQNAHTTPIGIRLFAPESGIRRGKMTVTRINHMAIDDLFVANYIKILELDDKLYFRVSIFSHGKQQMRLKEYILPGLKIIVNKYKNKRL